MIQAAAAKTVHATTLPGARAALHEYLTVLMCLALRQRRAEQAAAAAAGATSAEGEKEEAVRGPLHARPAHI
jgi:hypothetical protein